MATMHCLVATPTRELFSGEVHYASVPSVEGDYGVLPGHEMIVSMNRAGGLCTLHLDEAGTQTETFILLEGLTQFSDNILTVLGRFGRNVKDIDRDKVAAKAEKMRAHIEELKAVSEDDQDKAELEISQLRLQWYELQVQYVDSHK
jgi:F-type H+-transporting ATPase subunit epsilon